MLKLKGLPPPPALKGPPPLPGLKLPAKVIEKPKQVPRIPLRKIQWDKVRPDKINGTVWAKLDDTKVKLDIDFIEKEFAKDVA